MKKGDYIYYYSFEGDTIPAVVENVSRNGKKILIENFYGKLVWVFVKNCVLQDSIN